jgi:hypothetical protein
MRRFRSALLAASAAGLIAAGIAHAQPAPTYDPAQLPVTKGKIAGYSLTPRGDVDGVFLDNGTEVHFPPHLGTQIVFTARPGDAVTIHGLQARSLPLVQGVSLTNDATNQTVTDTGPPGGPGPRGPGRGEPLEAQGRIKMQLHGPRGDLNGVLLEDGTMIHLPPPEAQRLAAQLAPGQTIFASGEGVDGPLGKSIAARAIGPTQAQAVQIAAPPPPPPGGPRHPPGGPGVAPPPPPG